MIIINADTLKSNVIAVRSMSEIPSSLREELVAFGLARVVAYGVAIPAEPVANPVAFFNENAGDVKAIVSKINESTVINLSKILTLAGVVYRARYDMVHDSLSKSAQALAQTALATSSDFNLSQQVADALQLAEGSTDLSRSVAFALNLFAVTSVPGVEAAAAE